MAGYSGGKAIWDNKSNIDSPNLDSVTCLDSLSLDGVAKGQLVGLAGSAGVVTTLSWIHDSTPPAPRSSLAVTRPIMWAKGDYSQQRGAL